MLKMPTISDAKRDPQNAFFLLSTGTIIATNTVIKPPEPSKKKKNKAAASPVDPTPPGAAGARALPPRARAGRPWACAACTLINEVSARKCVLCKAERPRAAKDAPLPEGTWEEARGNTSQRKRKSR